MNLTSHALVFGRYQLLSRLQFSFQLSHEARKCKYKAVLNTDSENERQRQCLNEVTLSPQLQNTYSRKYLVMGMYSMHFMNMPSSSRRTCFHFTETGQVANKHKCINYSKPHSSHQAYTYSTSFAGEVGDKALMATPMTMLVTANCQHTVLRG